MNGWLIIDKPLGLSSAQVVGAVKRILREAGIPKTRIGHGGTLDPLATGVLPIALGEATKLAGRMLEATKGYSFTVAFGTATSTDDGEGEVVETSDVRPPRAAIEAALPAFTGSIAQVPPIYSALKVGGQRAYALARAGEAVVLAERHVTILSLTVHAEQSPPQRGGVGVGSDTGVELGASWPGGAPHPCPSPSGEGIFEKGVGLEEATFDVLCSKGTYVRSLARDIARALGTVGHVSMLRRTKAGPFDLAQAISLDNLAALGQSARLEQALLPLAAGLDDIPVLPVEPEQAAFLRRGQQLAGRPDITGLHLATDQSVPVALVDVSIMGVRVVRGFNLQ